MCRRGRTKKHVGVVLRKGKVVSEKLWRNGCAVENLYAAAFAQSVDETTEGQECRFLIALLWIELDLGCL